VFIIRNSLVLLNLLLLANCAAQIDPAKYQLAERDTAERDTAVRTTFDKRHFAKRDIDYASGAVRSTSDVPKIDIGKSTMKSTVGDIGLSREDIHEKPITLDGEKSDAGYGSQTVPAAMRVGQPADSSSAPKNSAFLDTLVKEDKENQILKRKTIICRGC
jgi:hypothetical protein